MSDEYEFEPIPGLPAHLPEGETILWQGSPVAGLVARRALHVGLVAVYFAALLVWRVLTGTAEGHTPAEIAVDSIPLLLTATAGIGLIGLLAYLIARTTIYTITNRRVVMRFGVALPMTVNVPFASIQTADIRELGGGAGDISLAVDKLGRLGFAHLWPHTRAWHVRKPHPTLRGLKDVASVATILSRALHAADGQPARGLVSPPAGRGNQMSPQPSAPVAA